MDRPAFSASKLLVGHPEGRQSVENITPAILRHFPFLRDLWGPGFSHNNREKLGG